MTAQREWFEKDYYKILGIAEDATPKDVTRAYRQLARKYHPDTNAGDATAEERFKEVSAAYDVVGDPEKRKEYDELRRLGPAAGMGDGAWGGGFGAGGPGPGGGGFRVEDLGGLGDLLGGMFGRGARRGGARGATTARKGADLEADLHLAFGDAVHGVTTTLTLTSEALCSTCGGSGAAPGTTPVTCSRCGGRGVVDDNQGFFSFSQPCPACAGRGTIVETPCPTCVGRGVERRPRDVKVRIPAGVEDGQRIRLAGRGEPGRSGGPAGDLYVRVQVGQHDRFGRKGGDLTLSVPITYAEATLGTELTVPTLDGPTVTVRIPSGTRHGRTFRVRGRGVEAKKGTGDLLVTVEIAVPKNPSGRERELLEQLAQLDDGSLRAHLVGG
ncbi:MAG: molecular chaperone DnaJ [Acidimicrobiia bacterium]|nr:molecular chaperone DnaJ [Acidimicrobiia bacterium]